MPPTDAAASARSLTQIADVLLEADAELALPLHRAAARLAPQDPATWRRAAVAAASAGETSEALASFDEALSLDPEDRNTVLALGNTFGGRGRLASRVITVGERYLVNHPADPDVSALVDRARSRLERVEKRVTAWFRDVPTHLVEKVNGTVDRELFGRIGEAVAETVNESVEGTETARSALDFGCGLGRVLRPMMQRCPGAEFVGFDVDPMMLEQARRLPPLSSCRFVHTTRDLPSGSMDLIYVISVFTHLTATTDYWLSEVRRLLSDRGQAFVTFHDETLWAEFREKGQVPPTPGEESGRWCVGKGSEGSTMQGVFYKTEAWERQLSAWFDVVRTEPRGLRGHQSFSVVRPRSIGPVGDEVRGQYIGSLEDELYELRRSTKLLF